MDRGSRASRWIGNFLAVSLLSIGSWGCKVRPTESDVLADDPTRKLIGMDHPYIARELSSADVLDLDRSMAKRRIRGWETIQQLFQPVIVPGASENEPEQRMALWQTWFDSGEILKMFELLYVALPREDRVLATGNSDIKPVPAATVQCILDRYASDERLKRRHGADFENTIMKRIAQLKERPGRSLSGVDRAVTLFNQSVVRHYLTNYAKVIRCTKAMADTYQGDLKVNFAACFFTEFPPDAVAIKAIWARDDNTVDIYDTSASGVAQALTGDQEWLPSCEVGPCRIPGNDPALDASMFSTHVKYMDGQESSFHLTAMHIATKEARDWTWTSLWWSPKPNEDFGEDRPSWFGSYKEKQADHTFRSRTFPALRNYKMCNATGYLELDENLLAKVKDFQVDKGDRSLEGALLSAYSHGVSRPRGSPETGVLTWCSNPFVEKDPGMSDTNCMGCHQHAGPEGDMASVRDQERNIFPADYAFSYEFFMDVIAKENDNIKYKFSKAAEDYQYEDSEPCPAS